MLGSIAVYHASTEVEMRLISVCTISLNFLLSLGFWELFNHPDLKAHFDSSLPSMTYINTKYLWGFGDTDIPLWLNLTTEKPLFGILCITLLTCILMGFNHTQPQNFFFCLLATDAFLITSVWFWEAIAFVLYRASPHLSVSEFYILLDEFRNWAFPFLDGSLGISTLLLYGLLGWVAIYFIANFIRSRLPLWLERKRVLDDKYGSILTPCLLFVSVHLIAIFRFFSDLSCIIPYDIFLYSAYLAFSCWYWYFFVSLIYWTRDNIRIAIGWITATVIWYAPDYLAFYSPYYLKVYLNSVELFLLTGAFVVNLYVWRLPLAPTDEDFKKSVFVCYGLIIVFMVIFWLHYVY